MEERFVPLAQAEARPVASEGEVEGRALGVGLQDPRALQILSTEHWSLLTARSLVYNEAFARAGMFLAFLSATLLVLGLISTATGFSEAFLVVAALILALDLFIGLATIGRINGASEEDLRYLQGMSRLRHAYHEMVPGLEDYFITSKYDDFDSVVSFYGPGTSSSVVRGIAHGLTTMPVMISVMCCALGAMLSAVLLLLAHADPVVAGTAAALVFVILFVAMAIRGYRNAMAFATRMPALFPGPGRSGVDDPPG